MGGNQDMPYAEDMRDKHEVTSKLEEHDIMNAVFLDYSGPLDVI